MEMERVKNVGGYDGKLWGSSTGVGPLERRVDRVASANDGD